MAEEKRSSIKRVGGVANHLATAASLLTANWGLAVGAALGIVSAVWLQAFEFASRPEVQTGARVFIWALWIWVGIRILRTIQVGVRTTPVVDYVYALAMDGLEISFDADSAEKAFQLGTNLRNLANGAMKVQIEEYRVVLGDRTLPDSDPGAKVLQRFGSKGVRCGVFRGDAVAGNPSAHVSLVATYGPVDGHPVRRYRVKYRVHLRLDGAAAAINELLSETDEPI